MSVLCEKYTVLEQLYQTESNTVFLTEHISLKTKRIVKKMKKESNFQLPEVDILKRLSHPNIPRIIDIEEDDEFLYLIREYAEGKTLEEWMEEKEKFQEAELLQIAEQLASAIRYLHEGFENPIIYRDLKPENIILNEKGYLWLIDFGIARYNKPERKQDTEFLGTKAYAAPEQFGVFRSDEKSDIYAFGMTLYCLLSRHRITALPYKRVEINTLYREYAEDFVKLIYECSEPNREQRPENFTEIANRLRRLRERHEENSIPENAKIYMGLRRGAGTSFITYSHAFKEAQTGKKIAILDWSESQQMAKLSYTADSAEVKKDSLIVDGMEIFPRKEENNTIYSWKEYDRVYIDYGLLDSSKRKRVKDRKQDVKLICSGTTWDMADLDEMIFEEKLIDFHFILNLAETDIITTVKSDYPETDFEFFSYQTSLQSYSHQSISYLSQPNEKFQLKPFWKSLGAKVGRLISLISHR